jgi:drug/metabolite transporter (DMT)-like permease
MIRVHTALFFVSLFYAILFSWAGQIMPNYLSAEAFVWLRIAFATLLFHSINLFLKSDPIQWKLHWKEFAICGFFGTSANMYLFFKGLESTFPINGAILMLFTPVFVAIFDHFRLKEWPKLQFIGGLILAAAGCWYLISSRGVHFSKKTLVGDLYVSINAILYAVYLVRVKKLTAVYNPITVNRWTFTFGLIYITPIGLMEFCNTDFSVIPASIGIKILYILIFTSFLVYTLNAYSVKKAGPSLAGIYIYLQPLLATIIAFMLGTESISITKAIVVLIILAGVYLATRFVPKEEKV